MYVSNVGKHSCVLLTFKYLDKFVLENNTIFVSNVLKLSLIIHPFSTMKVFTLQRSPMNMNKIGNAFLV
jgi:hypothetical protein